MRSRCSLDDWMKLVTERRQSGLTDAARCEAQGISSSCFYNAVSCLRKRACQIRLAKPALLILPPTRKIYSNFFIGDVRNHPSSSVHSMYSKNGIVSLVVKTVHWQMQSLIELLMTAIRSISKALMLNTISPCERYMD